MASMKLIALILTVINGLLTPVLQDPEVRAPVVDRMDEDEKQRLVIAISQTGQITHEEKVVTDEQLTELCKNHVTKHPEGVLNLRANKGVSFKHVRGAIRASAKGGLDNVVFSTFEVVEKEAVVDDEKAGPTDLTEKLIQEAVEQTIKSREDDLKISLPAVAPDKEVPALAPMLIRISQNGSISINRGDAKEILDTDPGQRDLPQLKQRLKLFILTAKAGGHEPVVKLHADSAASQQRVVDVLNVLASLRVSKVTFIDQVAP